MASLAVPARLYNKIPTKISPIPLEVKIYDKTGRKTPFLSLDFCSFSDCVRKPIPLDGTCRLKHGRTDAAVPRSSECALTFADTPGEQLDRW
jgi:hypothetical protein